MVKYCRRKNIPVIIGCDANAHNEVRGSSDTNLRGEYLLKFLIKENHTLSNIGNTPIQKQSQGRGLKYHNSLSKHEKFY